MVKININRLLRSRDREDLIPEWENFLATFPEAEIDENVPCEDVYGELIHINDNMISQRYVHILYNNKIKQSLEETDIELLISIFIIARNLGDEIMHGDDERDMLFQCEETKKHELVEPIIYKSGKMTAVKRNQIYRSHNLAGVGKRIILTEEEKKENEVCKNDIYHMQYTRVIVFFYFTFHIIIGVKNSKKTTKAR